MHVHFEQKMPCCSGTKKMLMSGSECVCRTAWIYPLRVSVTLTPCRRWGKGDLSLSCPLCLEVHPVCVQACASVLSAVPEGTVLTPSLPCPTLARVVGLLLSHALSSQAADVPCNAGKGGGLKAGRHHAKAAWICNKHTHTHAHWQSLAHVSYLLKLM